LSQQQPTGTVRTTPPLALVVAALFGGLSAWLIVTTANAFGWIPPQVPWTAPIALFLAAGLVGALAYSTHQQIHVRRSYIDPHRAVAFLVLGKASALTGALVAGGYLGFGLMFLSRFDAETPRERVIRSAVSVVGGIALGVAGLLLERACKVPPTDSEEGEGDEDDEIEPDTHP
jgi:Protein of unknown function (DUF3180)